MRAGKPYFQESGVKELKELRQRFQGFGDAPDDGNFLTEWHGRLTSTTKE